MVRKGAKHLINRGFMTKKTLNEKILELLKRVKKPYNIPNVKEYIESIRSFFTTSYNHKMNRAVILSLLLSFIMTNIFYFGTKINKVYAKNLPSKTILETTTTNKETKAFIPVSNNTLKETKAFDEDFYNDDEVIIFTPTPTYLNLTKRFADSKETDVSKSLAANTFNEIFSMEGEWYSDIISKLDLKPEEMAKKLGLGRDRVLGKFNVTDKEQDPLNPDSWTIKKWNEVKLNVHDANGTLLNSNSNLKEILAMASVYSFYHNWEDSESFKNYAIQLWKSSRNHSISMSEISYEGDVLTDAMIEVAKNEENVKSIIDYFNNKKLENNANTQAVEDESQAQIENVEVATSSNANNFESKFELDSNGDVVFTKNAGKLNLNIDINIYNLNGKRNLFTIDKIGNDKKNFNDSWQGWTEDKIAQVRDLANQDWFKEYGLSISSFSTGKPLSKEEITTYLNELPEDLSEDRRKVVEFALNSVGYIPYYFGGKPASSGYTGNNFYNIINPDYKGRVFRGLDCSGWVNWVMWSATENKPSAFSTSSFINAGRGISRGELKAGDIIVRAGSEDNIGHIVIFLKWDADGNMVCIHETGQPVNNVTLTTMYADWNYRNILD